MNGARPRNRSLDRLWERIRARAAEERDGAAAALLAELVGLPGAEQRRESMETLRDRSLEAAAVLGEGEP